MLSAQQIDHFRTFGFVVLRNGLGEQLTLALQVEVDLALRDAYASTYHERLIDGISGHYLPMASRLTPLSTSLVCDDERLMAAAEELLGGPVLPECPEGVLYFAETGWHCDDGIGVEGVKFATYFEELAEHSGALRFLPGSHQPEQVTRLNGYRKRQMARPFEPEDDPRFPGYVAAMSPGDVVAFDLHTWHASMGGRDRLAWTIVYQRCPETGEEAARTLRSMADSFEQQFRGVDRQRYPIWRDWLAGAATHPRRGPVVERLRDAGVLRLPGADLGW